MSAQVDVNSHHGRESVVCGDRLIDNVLGTWAAAAEYTGEQDMPVCTLAGNTLREIIRVSIGGKQLSLHLSNEFSDEPVFIKSVYIANTKDSCDIDKKTATYLTFNGQKEVIIPAKGHVASDLTEYNLQPLQLLTISICYGRNVPQHATSHRGSRTTSYILRGTVTPSGKAKVIEKTDHWYNISKLNVTPNGAKAIAVLGNSITDGRGSTTNKQNRWTDFFATHLNNLAANNDHLTSGATNVNANFPTGVLNLGIGGNCVVEGGISEPALKRFDRDILGQSGVDLLIIFEGTNDIGTSTNAERTAKQLIEAYQVMIDKAHQHGIKVYGATITPFKGNGWYSVFHEAARQTVNEWIRDGKAFDGIIDFDSIVRDPNDPERLNPKYSDDWLHLNPLGYEAMGRYAAKIISEKSTLK